MHPSAHNQLSPQQRQGSAKTPSPTYYSKTSPSNDFHCHNTNTNLKTDSNNSSNSSCQKPSIASTDNPRQSSHFVKKFRLSSYKLKKPPTSGSSPSFVDKNSHPTTLDVNPDSLETFFNPMDLQDLIHRQETHINQNSDGDDGLDYDDSDTGSIQPSPIINDGDATAMTAMTTDSDRKGFLPLQHSNRSGSTSISSSSMLKNSSTSSSSSAATSWEVVSSSTSFQPRHHRTASDRASKRSTKAVPPLSVNTTNLGTDVGANVGAHVGAHVISDIVGGDLVGEYVDDDDDDDDDDNDNEQNQDSSNRPPLSAAAKVKSFFPRIGSFYRPLSGRMPVAMEVHDNNINYNTNNAKGGFDNANTMPYDHHLNNSQLSFNDNSVNTEAELMHHTSSEITSQLDPKNNRRSSATQLTRSPVRSSLPKHQRTSQFLPRRNQSVLEDNDSTYALANVIVANDDVQDVSLNSDSITTPKSSSKDDEEDEDDTLLPLANPLPLSSPEEVYNAGRRRSLPLNATNKLMTKTQFDNYRRSMLVVSDHNKKKDKLIFGRRVKEFSDVDTDDDYNDDDTNISDSSDDDSEINVNDMTTKRNRFEEDAETKKENIRMRMKQDAHLSVYRQKMTRVTGSQTGLSSYGGELRSSSSYGTLNGMIPPGEDDDGDGDDEYDDVPLGILKAHGFPTSVKSRPLSAQPSLARLALEEQQNPTNISLLYQNTGNNGETSSLRSVRSVPGMRPDNANAIPLPSFLNNPSNRIPRGLVGEIAREEEAKQRRKSMGNILGGQRASTMLQSSASAFFPTSGVATNYAGSAYNGIEAQNNSNNSNKDNSEIQQQLQQMMQMQMQMLQQMQVPSSPPLKKNFSSFNVAKNHGGAPSIRSFAISERSVDSGRHRHSNISSFNDLGQSDLRLSKSQTFGARRQSSPRLARPPSTMHLSTTKNVEDEDEDEDDAGWQEMLEKRRQLKELWKQQQSVPLVS